MERKPNLRQPGAGTISPEIISSLITGGSDGGGGHTIESIISSVDRMIPTRSGGSVRDDLLQKWEVFIRFMFHRSLDHFMPYLIIMHKACSSWSTLSKYIMSRSETIAPFITIISSPLMTPSGPRCYVSIV